MVTAPGLPAPEVDEHLSYEDSASVYAEGTEFLISRASMVTSTGTYLDAPRHRYRDGEDVAEVALERCVELPLLVLDAPAEGEIGGELLPDDVTGCAVLFRTGWSAHWGTPRYGSPEHPHLHVETARLLASRGAALVGIDAVNVDGTEDGERPIHSTLLRAGILIVENLTGLEALPARGATFTAAPLPFRTLPSFPVRAYARLQ